MRIKWFFSLVFTVLVFAACRLGPEQVAPATLQTIETAPAPEITPTATELPPLSPIPSPPSRRLRPGEMVLAADVDDIPAIFAEDALFVDVTEGDREWAADELVIGLEVGDDARAYPIRLLSSHEIVNDVVGGEPVAVTWCPLCFSAIVFSRIVDDRELTFGVSGYLYYNNLVMYDHRTNSFWSQLSGEGIRGAYRGERLPIFPSVMTSWGEWKETHPDTRILSAERLGQSAADVIDPYANYYTSGAAGIIGQVYENDLLKAKVLVVGLTVGREARAYTLESVKTAQLINDHLSSVPLAIVHDPALDTVIAYRREISGQVLTLELADESGLLRDQETGSLWEVRTGRAVAGSLTGQRLDRLASPLVYWFAWSDFHPDTELYSP